MHIDNDDPLSALTHLAGAQAPAEAPQPNSVEDSPIPPRQLSQQVGSLLHAGRERRADVRFPADDPARIRPIQQADADAHDVRVLDVSRGGMRLRVSLPLYSGELVQVFTKTLILLTEVRYCLPAGENYQIGVSIGDMITTAGHRRTAPAQS
jgi:hypothetical protein